MKVSGVGRNLVPDTWTADTQGANWVRDLNVKAALVVEELMARNCHGIVW